MSRLRRKPILHPWSWHPQYIFVEYFKYDGHGSHTVFKAFTDQVEAEDFYALKLLEWEAGKL